MLLGRDLECARLESLIGATRAGDGGALVLRGVPGAGKSALLDFAAGRADELAVLRAGGIPGEAEVAFAGLLELLRPVLALLPQLPRPQHDALGGALGLVAAVERDRFLVGAATLGLLLLASAERPVLVCVDDAHWLDAPSLDALVFVGRRLAGAPVGMVLAARDEPLPTLDAARLEQLGVPALDREATGVLAARLIGRLPDKGGVDEIFRRTQGLPLAIAEWSRLGDSDEVVAMPVPISLLVERAYARGVEAAPEQVRLLLLVAAADDSGDLSTVLAAAERLGVSATAADGAEELGLIEVAEGRVRFRHPLVRSAVYQSAAAPLRRRVHGALAACLSGEWQADRRAWHRAAAVASTDEEVAVELTAMAERARARSGYAVAARAHERAAQITPEPEPRARRAVAAADALSRAGQGTRAEQLLTHALEDAQAPLVRAEAQRLLGRLAHFRGDPLTARAVLVDAGTQVTSHDPRMAADIFATALHSAMFCERADLVLETAATTARLASAAGVELDGRLNSMAGAALTICGNMEAGEPYLRRSIALADAGDLSSADPFMLAYAANSHGWLSEYAAARDLAARARSAAEEQGAPGPLGYATMLLAEYECALCEFDSAAAMAAAAKRVGEETHQPQVVAWSVLHEAFVAANRGQHETAAQLVAATRDLRVPLWFNGIDAGDWVLSTSGLAAGDADAVIAALEVGTDFSVCQVNYTPWTVGADLVEAYVRAGRLGDAVEAVDALTPRAYQRWAQAALGRARGLVTEDQEFEGPLARSIVEFAELGLPLQEARSRLCYGERMRRDGRRVEARAQLRSALAIFERLRCDPWVERTSTELRASGETLRARSQGSPVDELTPQELQVATLAAAGLSNKEVAARLFLSTKTIEAHLHRTYRKLGIRTRNELAPLLAARTPKSPAGANAANV